MCVHVCVHVCVRVVFYHRGSSGDQGGAVSGVGARVQNANTLD